MKTLHRIIELADQLCDESIDFDLSIGRTQGRAQEVRVTVTTWAGNNLIGQTSFPGDKGTTTDALTYLELIAHHGYRESEVAA